MKRIQVVLEDNTAAALTKRAKELGYISREALLRDVFKGLLSDDAPLRDLVNVIDDKLELLGARTDNLADNIWLQEVR